MCQGKVTLFGLMLLPGNKIVAWCGTSTPSFVGIDSDQNHANALGECPPFCDTSSDPCGEDSKVCKDCPLCEGKATAFFLTYSHMNVKLCWRCSFA